MKARDMKIANRDIGETAPCFIIAEIGINHGGSADLAIEMLKSAKRSGADAAKFQTVDVEESYVPGTASYREFKGKELALETYIKLMQIGRDLDIVVFTTPADVPSLELALKCEMPAFKISSSMLASTPLISAMAKTGLPLILSTGMGTEADVDHAVAAIKTSGESPFALLQCTSLYPAPADTLNLSAMGFLSERYGCPVGYSDHHVGDLAVTTAVALGATIIEKHFTFDTSTPGADHSISLDPAGFARMVERIRAVEQMKGDGRKRPAAEEERLKSERHRCLIARRDIPAGKNLEAADLCLKRPMPGQAGLHPSRMEWAIGRRTNRAIVQNTPVREQDIA